MATTTKTTKPRARAKQAPLEGAGSRVRRRNYGKNHAYYITKPNGVESKLDGVTTLIGDGMRKKALENWAGNETAKYAVDNWEQLAELTPTTRFETLKKARFQSRDEAAARGTAVHALAEQIVDGKEVDVPDELAGHVQSAVRFLDEWKVRSLLNEATVWNEKGHYGGTLDGVATSDVWDERCGEKRVILFDWKTNRSGIYGETALQLSAYGNAEFYIGADGADHAMSELGVTDHWAVWVRSDGYSVYPMDRSEQTFRTFQYVATVARRTGQKDAMDALKGAEIFAERAA